jgi:perosamine synthetase
MIPYGRQFIDEEDIQAVIEVLQSDWLTTGPIISQLEQAFAEFVNAKEAVAVSSGTAALHSAMYALGIGPGDEVIVPPITFSATANCAVYQGATPVFADVDPETLLINPFQVQAKITSRTKAIIAVDYTGHPADYDALKSIAKKQGISLVADAAHALGAGYKGHPVGALADLNTFSFHPVKHITTGEGGMITTDDPRLAERMRLFRNHGIATDHHQREKQGSWFYEMVDLGYNYRITDFQCALGLSQLKKLKYFLDRRREIAKKYNDAFSLLPEITPVAVRPNVSHAYHLYVIQINPERMGTDRTALFQAFRQKGIGVNVHYIPVHLHPFYRKTFGTGPGLCPVAEEAYEKIISLPIFPAMDDRDVERVVEVIRQVVATKEYRQRDK